MSDLVPKIVTKMAPGAEKYDFKSIYVLKNMSNRVLQIMTKMAPASKTYDFLKS